MEKQQLDFTAPLLSVRRRDMKAMDECMSFDRRDTTLSVAEFEFNFDHVTKRAAVPFVWEHIPGKARKGPEDCNIVRNQSLAQSAFFSNKEKGSCDMENDDDAYIDSLQAFSQTTVSRDCSVSSWSESDEMDVELSRTSCSYRKTHDFILRRFLPAAKAMTLELPCHVFKKQPSDFAQGQPTEEIKEMVSAEAQKPVIFARVQSTEEIKEMVSGEAQKPLLKRNDSWTVTYFKQGKDGQEKQEQIGEPEADHYSAKSIITPVKPPSFLPRFCIKSSSSLLNQVAGMQHATKSYKGCKGETRKRNKAYRRTLPTPPSPNIDKLQHAVYNHKCDDMAHIGKANHGRYTAHSQTTGWSSPLTLTRGSPYRKIASDSPSQQMMGFTGNPTPAIQNSRVCRYKVNDIQTVELGPGRDYVSPVAEKTLHMDSVKAFSNLHPPLPKSPSDSWLSRTLPSVPSRSSSPHSRKVSVTLTSSVTSTKWENIVKTSYLHRDHVRYSQELVRNSAGSN